MHVLHHLPLQKYILPKGSLAFFALSPRYHKEKWVMSAASCANIVPPHHCWPARAFFNGPKRLKSQRSRLELYGRCKVVSNSFPSFISCTLSQYTHLNSTKITKFRNFFRKRFFPSSAVCDWLLYLCWLSTVLPDKIILRGNIRIHNKIFILPNEQLLPTRLALKTDWIS